jgi:hypothetical protein
MNTVNAARITPIIPTMSPVGSPAVRPWVVFPSDLFVSDRCDVMFHSRSNTV